VHDITGELTATAYTGSQAAFLPDRAEPSFVFGAFRTNQVSVERVERLTGLKFGDLRTRDPLAGAGVSFASALAEASDIMLD
jgi:DNA/RNA endonuclease G (NUC1)